MKRRNRSRRKQKLPEELVKASIESLTHECRGVARVEGKAVFVDGALPTEEVVFKYTALNKTYDEAEAVEILTASPDRVEPGCPHFGVCGGCSLQHMDASAQIFSKQKIMLDNFKHIGGGLEPEVVAKPLTAEYWGYRRKARLGAKYVHKKETMLVGFRERKTSFLADLMRCDVLHPSVGLKLMELRGLIGSLSIYMRVPQVEVAVGDEVVALIFRHLEPFSEDDHEKLIAFGQTHNFHIYLQPKGPATVHLLWPETSELSYKLPDYDLEMIFKPSDFTQVNTSINNKMIARAIEWLDPQPKERVLDLFCGLGNFTLPLARHFERVVGVEGDESLVVRGKMNAQHNNINNVEFYGADLTKDPHEHPWFEEGFDKILLDPPRSGAYDIVKYLAKFGASKIVYVSCNPATLARDAEVLVNAGYELDIAGVMDMFPHTTHVESIALFKKCD